MADIFFTFRIRIFLLVPFGGAATAVAAAVVVVF